MRDSGCMALLNCRASLVSLTVCNRILLIMYDNCLSRDEFQSFFADGILKPDELEELFNKIDTHKSNNIDTGELSTYFSSNLGPFRAIFGTIEELSQGVSNALQDTAQEYPKKSFYDQFTVRFMMKEISTQLAAVQQSLETAADHLEADALKDRESQTLSVDALGPPTNSTAGWIRRRARRQLSTQTSIPLAGLSGLTEQVDRLKGFIDELENKVKIDPVDEEQVSLEDDNLVTVVSRKMDVLEEHESTFREHLRTYIETADNEPGCISHMTSAVLTTLKEKCVGLLAKDEECNSFNIPEKWMSGTES
ncbi:putative N-terminal EF-hand calcium-binding protein 1-like [Apostichopus japonicus]|uniref:Putative N-terminal EF-hand calcium-binding protein 1-like n=1 Tax=Stichopus japonicus TaxID=307972 RepID=A0A2G8LFL3_STIJA|nr:putative N-terminal EF-hand calcium-binding protein 1-like [Apostichopus japonicus]